MTAFAICLSLAVLVAMAGSGSVLYLSATLKKDISVLQKQKAINAQQQAQLTAISDTKKMLQDKWHLLTGLRSGASADAMLLMIDKALAGDDVWFNVWQFRRAGIVVDKAPDEVNTGYFIVVPRGQGKAAQDKTQIQTHMSINGQARDHAALSNFVKRLFKQPGIENVRVVRTNLRRYTNVNVVDFDISVVINSHVETG